ncbi:hypothetical protein PRZ48_009707 [Zasmidium cellare]|uniref:DUF6604 domain-containing protein n=1 Tax=Zasmidium cellare TaxID=395010 RepID=A0ABR0ECG1_ZASCE|nr:hypothetical protein PRZ48_009707 [Zasmidium cellare]
MDSQPLGRQILYKASTKRFLEWLVQTAERCTTAQTLTAAAPSRSTKRITTRDIISFAEAISTSSALVPAAIIRLLEEVIEGRQACADWYALQPLTKDLAEENESHAFFIGVLRQVLGLLSEIAQPECRSNKETKPSSKKQKKSLNDLGCDFNNLFAQLELEEPSDEPLGQASISEITIEAGNKKSRISLDDDDSKDDTAFRLFCFLEDAKDVRIFLNEAWREYERGDISMAAVATITEAGIGLLRISSGAFTAANKAFSDWYYILAYLGLEQQTIHRPYESPFIYLYPRSTGSSPQDPKSPNDLAELICAASAYHLQNLKAKMHEQEAKYNPSMLAKGTFISRTYVDHDLFDLPRLLLNPGAVELVSWRLSPHKHGKQRTANQERTLQSSEFVEGILDFYRTKQLSPWLPIAAQIYCDIYEIVGSDGACMSNQYLDEVRAMQGIVKRQNDTFGGPLTTQFWEQTLLDLDEYHDHFSLYLRADSERLKRIFKKDLGFTEGASLRSIQGLPCVMGGHLYRYKMAFHQGGIGSANRATIVLCMAHLYTAGRRLGLIKTEWHDMEKVISAQKTKEPLVTKSSNNADPVACLKHFLIALGVPAREFAHNKIPKLPSEKQIAEKAKRIKCTLQVPESFDEARQNEENLGVWRGELIELMLMASTKKAHEAQPSKKGAKKQDISPGSFTPRQLLGTFKKAFIADEPMLNFDFFNFTYDCAGMENYIRDLVLPSLEKSEGLTPKDVEKHFEFVYYLLRSQLQYPSASLHPQDRPATCLEIACGILEVLISQQAQNEHHFSSNKFSIKAFQLSSGRIPKDLRPKFRKFDPSTIAIAPMEQMLADEKAVFNHFTAAHKVVYDPQGSAQKFEELAEWQKGEEEKVKKEMGLRPDDPFPGWSCGEPVSIHISELGLTEEDLKKFKTGGFKQRMALNELVDQEKLNEAVERHLRE